jgi:hypothetical protein
VQAGDNFAVSAPPYNDEGVSFYILQCQTLKHIVQEDFDCVWGVHFEAGDTMLCATYYQNWGRRETQNYVLLRNSRPAYIDCSLVLACKFQMIPWQHRVKGGDPVYTLLDETMDVINTALEEFQEEEWGRVIHMHTPTVPLALRVHLLHYYSILQSACHMWSTIMTYSYYAVDVAVLFRSD